MPKKRPEYMTSSLITLLSLWCSIYYYQNSSINRFFWKIQLKIKDESSHEKSFDSFGDLLNTCAITFHDCRPSLQLLGGNIQPVVQGKEVLISPN